MQSSGCKRVRLPLGVVLTLWGGLLFAPASASADCAHYVVAKHDSAQLLGSLEGRIFAEAVGSIQQLPGDPLKPASPCPGGICSRGPTLPITPAPDRVTFDHWGLLAAGCLSDGAGAVERVVAQHLVRPVGFAQAIFHPPRHPISVSI
jgi:hypothetical protein